MRIWRRAINSWKLQIERFSISGCETGSTWLNLKFIQSLVLTRQRNAWRVSKRDAGLTKRSSRPLSEILYRPLHGPYLHHQLRPHPLHLPHLVRRHAAAPAGSLRLRQIDEGAFIDMVRPERLEDLSTQMRNWRRWCELSKGGNRKERPSSRPALCFFVLICLAVSDITRRLSAAATAAAISAIHKENPCESCTFARTW